MTLKKLTLFLFHGGAMSGGSMATIAARLTAYHCPMPDLRGHSTNQAVAFEGLDQCAEDVTPLVAEDMHGLVHLFGLPLGAYVALHTLAKCNTQIETAVVLGVALNGVRHKWIHAQSLPNELIPLSRRRMQCPQPILQAKDERKSEMQSDHPNVDIIAKINRDDMAASADVFHPDVVWHFFNSMVSDVAGSYHGLDGIAEFFRRVHTVGNGKFHIEPRGAWAVGDELVLVQTRNRLGGGETTISFDVVVVWRIVDGLVKEVWDIPAIYTAKTGAAWDVPKEAVS